MFQDRVEAGRRLAQLLESYRESDSMVLAVPRGGVVVGYEVASRLGLPLDVVVPRKLGAPGEPELAIGAVAPWDDEGVVIDQESVRFLGVSRDYILREIEEQRREIARRLRLYRGTDEPPNIAGKTALLIDDGIATGCTLEAAVKCLRKLGAAKIVAAAPVSSAEAADRLSWAADEFYTLATPEPFMAVGRWYVDFDQTSDEEVIRLLSVSKDG